MKILCTYIIFRLFVALALDLAFSYFTLRMSKPNQLAFSYYTFLLGSYSPSTSLMLARLPASRIINLCQENCKLFHYSFFQSGIDFRLKISKQESPFNHFLFLFIFDHFPFLVVQPKLPLLLQPAFFILPVSYTVILTHKNTREILQAAGRREEKRMKNAILPPSTSYHHHYYSF